MKKIGVLLAGCGYLDGAEINESVFTLLALSNKNVTAKIFAPNIKQFHTVNHLTGEESGEVRNVLNESARIARGEIEDITKIKVSHLDALIIPGGFGVAKNLSDFAFKGIDAQVNESVQNIIKDFHQQKKPIGAICISPAVVSLMIKAKLTIGNDIATASAINSLGSTHQEATAEEVVIDKENKIVSTPAFMTSSPLSEIYKGIEKCVTEVIKLC